MLTDLLYPPADQRRTTTSLLAWWESRRLLFNAAVGLAGLLTLGVVTLVSHVPPGLPIHIAWQPIVAYGLMANVLYTYGWGIEAALQRWWKEKCPRIGPPLFRQGLIFSVGLTLLPIVLISMAWIARTGFLIWTAAGRYFF